MKGMFWDVFTSHFFLIMVFKVSTAIGSYYVSSTLSSWSEKDNICSVAVPPILYTSAGITVDINETSIDRDGAWVGYVETLIAFDYIGCLKSATVHSSGMILSQTSRIGSPGQCFSACGFGSFIGISDNECLCLKEGRTLNSLRSNYTECTAECEHQPGVACGGLTENGTRYISVYNLNRKGEHYIQTSSPGQYTTWLMNANICFFNEGFPIRFQNYSDFESVSESKNQMWTNVIRSSVISSEKQNIQLKALADVRMRHGFIRKQDEYLVLEFANSKSVRKRVVCDSDQDQNKSQEIQGLIVTVSTMTAIISVVVMTLIVAALTVLLIKKRRTNQRTRLTEVGYVHEQTSYITPISDAAGDGASTTIQHNGTGEVGTQNSQKIVYESLGERNDEEHGYGAVNTQRRAYESLGDRHDKEHSYGTPNTHRSAYESLGDRHDKEHSYGTPNTHRSAYESLGDRHDKEHRYGTPNTHRSAYESLGDRHDKEHGYGTPNTQRNAY